MAYADVDKRAKLYADFNDADDAWSAEGQRLFGKRWGDMRYTPKAHGEPGTELRRLYEAWNAARIAWESGSLRDR